VAVSGRLLQVVNSALYSMPRKVSGLQQAAGLLGLMALRNMVLAVEVFGSFRSPQRLPGISLDVLQARAHGRATLARTLAPRRLADSAYTAGLLRDIGRMVLMTRASDRYIACCYLVTTGLTWEQAEIEVFGVASRNLGGHLLRRWELPGEVLAAVEMVDDPGDPTVGGLVELAELFVREAAHAAEHPDEDPLMLVTRDMLEPLGLVSKAQTARDLARTMSKGLLEPPVQSAA
jgi:HD-like signal output (HDOD) protein